MKFGNIEEPVDFPVNQSDIPPLTDIGRVKVLRLLGTHSSQECLGVGFLRKNRHNDLVNWRFPNFVLVMVIRGSGFYSDNQGREYLLGPGSIFLRIPDLEHSNYVDSNSDYMECYLELGPLLFNALNGMNMLKLALPVYKIDLEKLPEISSRIWQLGWRLTFASDDELTGCLAEMLMILGDIWKFSRITEPGEKYRDLVELACHELSRNFAEPFSLQKFCRRHSVGYENFRKLFRVRTGMAPWGYRIRCKMEKAVSLLHNGNLTLQEISELLGYHSPYEFSAQFKKRFGVSPGNYRKQHR